MSTHNTFVNLVAIFEANKNLKDLFCYNEFTAEIEYNRDAIWHDRKKGTHITDDDFIFIKSYFAHDLGFEPTVAKLREIVVEIARRHSHHPVREYLFSLEMKWGLELSSQWLIKGCGAEDNEYIRAIGRKWLCGAVARILEPGVKFDHVLVLEGVENIGKSSALRVLGGAWFTDTVDLMMREKDIVEKMIGNWIIELPELKGLNQRDAESIKAFLSCQTDRQRLAYRRDAVDFPRQSVFAGTSNKGNYLLEDTGNRRFWPVECTKIDLQWLKDNKDQLFAEAIHYYTVLKEPLYLENHIYELAKKQQMQRLTVDDIWLDEIDRHLINRNEVTSKELLLDCLKFNSKDIKIGHTMMVGKILKKLGFDRERRNMPDGSKYRFLRTEKIAELEKERLGEEILWQDKQ